MTKAPEKRKTAWFKIRLTPTELKQLHEAADASGEPSAGEFLRRYIRKMYAKLVKSEPSAGEEKT